MAIYTGTLTSVASRAERQTQLSNFIGTYLSDILTYVTTLTWTLPGTTRKFVIGSGGATYANFYVRNLADTANLKASTSIYNSTNYNYVVVKNTDSGCFLLGTDPVLIWSKANETTICFSLADTQLFAITTDNELTALSATGLTGTTKLSNGKAILLPKFAKADDNLTYYDAPLLDIFGLPHGFTAGTSFIADGVDYLALTTQIAMRVN